MRVTLGPKDPHAFADTAELEQRELLLSIFGSIHPRSDPSNAGTKHLGRRASKMDLPQLQSAKQRAAHYRSEAEKFRKLADAEPIGRIRAQLFALAAQYGALAASLDVNLHDRFTS